MNIKQKFIIASIGMLVSVLLLSGGNYYASKMIKKEEHKLLEAEIDIEDAIKAKLAHFVYVAKFEKAFILNKPANLPTDPTKCALAKFLKKHESKMPPDLKAKLKKMLVYHTDLHNLVKEYNEKYIHIAKDLHEDTYQAFMEKYAWILEVVNVVLGESEDLVEWKKEEGDIGKYVTKYKGYFSKLGLSEIERDYDSIDAIHTTLHNDAEKLKNMPLSQRIEYYKNTIYPIFKKLQKVSEKYIDKLTKFDDENNAAIEEKIRKNTFRDLQQIDGFLDEYIKYQEEKKAELQKQVKNVSADMNILSIVFVLIAIIGFIYLQYVIMYVIREINDLEKVTANLSSGEADLTARLEIRGNDELSKVSLNINKFIEKLEEIVNNLSNALIEAKNVSNQVFQNSQEITHVIEHQSKLIKDTKTYTENIEHDLGIAEESVVTTSNDVINTQKVLEDMIESLRNVISEVQNNSENEAEIANKVTSLAEQSNQIKDIIEMIKEIADQTNLLALNAAIEAARAGEHGRGFAVVADEVRKLAERTQKSLGEIDSVISIIVQGVMDTQNEIERTAEKSRGVSEISENLVDKANETLDKLNETIEVAKQATKETTKINVTVRQLVDTSTGLTQDSKTTEEVADNLEVITRKLNDVTYKLNKEVSKFKIKR